MELMQLEMFAAVVEERSFLRAAERVFRTQPSVNIGLRKLEGRIGIPPLDRSHRRAGRLTPSGEIFYEYASRILCLRDETLSALKQEDCPAAGVFRIGVTSGGNFEWFRQLSTRFNSRYPEIRLEILCDRPANIFKDLSARRMDIALLSGRQKSDIQKREPNRHTCNRTSTARSVLDRAAEARAVPPCLRIRGNPDEALSTATTQSGHQANRHSLCAQNVCAKALRLCKKRRLRRHPGRLRVKRLRGQLGQSVGGDN